MYACAYMDIRGDLNVTVGKNRYIQSNSPPWNECSRQEVHRNAPHRPNIVQRDERYPLREIFTSTNEDVAEASEGRPC